MSIATRRRLGADERRRTILEAAAAVFAESGYERAKVADVARRVGVTEPVVFQNFGTKAALFEATLDAVASAYAEHLERLGPDAAQAIERLTRPEEFRRLHRRGEVGVLFADAVRHAHSGKAQRALGRVHSALVELVATAQEQGGIRKDLDATTLAWWVLSSFPAHAFRRAHGGLSLFEEEKLHGLLMESLKPA